MTARRAAAFSGDTATYDTDVKGIRRSRLQRHPAHPALSALCQRGDAEEHLGLSVLVPPPARLSRAGEGVAGQRTARDRAIYCQIDKNYEEKNMKNIIHHIGELLVDLRFHKMPLRKYLSCIKSFLKKKSIIVSG